MLASCPALLEVSEAAWPPFWPRPAQIEQFIEDQKHLTEARILDVFLGV